MARTYRYGWTRLSRPGDKCAARWRHDATGWMVVHCGHPTANWPYYLVDPRCPGRATVTFNGLGFKTLNMAMQTAEDVLDGTAVATNDRCGERTRRVVYPGED